MCNSMVIANCPEIMLLQPCITCCTSSVLRSSAIRSSHWALLTVIPSFVSIRVMPSLYKNINSENEDKEEARQ